MAFKKPDRRARSNENEKRKDAKFFGSKEKKASATKATSGSDVTQQRDLTIRVKSARGRKSSSTRWLQRQLNDPYVAEAQRQGYRSRAAFKLVEMHESLNIFSKGDKVVDLGAAPGGWCQVASKLVGPKGAVVGIDLQEIAPIEHVDLLLGDITDPNAQTEVIKALEGKADVVMSDMAASSTGHRGTDHLRVMALVETSLDFADEVLAKNGCFLAKVLTGGTDKDLLDRLNQDFAVVKHTKPKASRSDSREMYVFARGYRGKDQTSD